jgi:hypothetical protein
MYSLAAAISNDLCRFLVLGVGYLCLLQTATIHRAAPHRIHYLLDPLTPIFRNFYKSKASVYNFIAEVSRLWPANVQDLPSGSEFLSQLVCADAGAQAGYMKTHVEFYSTYIISLRSINATSTRLHELSSLAKIGLAVIAIHMV